VHLAVDSGVHTGAVWFQVSGEGDDARVNVFGDFYCYGKPAYDVALAVLAKSRELCGGRVDRATTDPAGRAATAIGPNVMGEYARAGFKPEFWPSYPGSVPDGLALVNSFVAVDPPQLTVHPRATALISAFANYKRAKRNNQYVDRPEDECHPYEDILDSLRGGLQSRFPEGRRPQPLFKRVHASRFSGEGGVADEEPRARVPTGDPPGERFPAGRRGRNEVPGRAFPSSTPSGWTAPAARNPCTRSSVVFMTS